MRSSVLAKQLDENAIKEFNCIKRIKKDNKALENFRITKDIWFANEIWDFNFANEENRARNLYRFDFKSINYAYVFFVKAIIFNELFFKHNSITHAHKIYDRSRAITNELYEMNIVDIRLINLQVVEDYIKKKFKNNKSSYVEAICGVLKTLIRTVENFYGYDVNEIIKFLEKTIRKGGESRPKRAVNNCIPFIFLNQIVSISIKDIDDENLKMDYRIIACLIVIMAETGIRGEDLTLIESNKVDIRKVKNKDTNISEEVSYLRFMTFKSHRETYTYLSEKALKAYRMCEKFMNKIIDNLSEDGKLRLLLSLYRKETLNGRFTLNQLKKMILEINKEELILLEEESRRYIFISAITGLQKRGETLFKEHLDKFFVRHERDFNIEEIPVNERDKIKLLKIQSESKYKKFFTVEQRKKLAFEQVLNKNYLYVNPHMFRVTVCTKLFMQHVHIDYIMRHLNHLEEDMSAYYNKSDDFIDELKEGTEIVASMETENGLIETDPLNVESDFQRNILLDDYLNEKIKKINEFLNKHNIKEKKSSISNVRKSFNEIISKAEKNDTPIIENEFGICVRSLLYGICEKRKYFSTVSDNYFIKVQLPTYRHIHFSYERFKQKAMGVENNRKIADNDERYSLEYERERKALIMFIDRTLNVEIALLEQDIANYGVDEIIIKNPQLKFIIDNVDSVREELQQWTV